MAVSPTTAGEGMQGRHFHMYSGIDGLPLAQGSFSCKNCNVSAVRCFSLRCRLHQSLGAIAGQSQNRLCANAGQLNPRIWVLSANLARHTSSVASSRGGDVDVDNGGRGDDNGCEDDA